MYTIKNVCIFVLQNQLGMSMELVKQKFYQTAVLWHPTKKQYEAGQRSKMVVEMKTILGADEKAVGMQAIKSIPKEFDEQLEQVEIVVRPF